MRGEEEQGEGEAAVVTFLYKLVSGAAGKSYGLNVARLANIPQDLLSHAAKMSAAMEAAVVKSTSAATKFTQLLKALDSPDSSAADVNAALEALTPSEAPE